MLQLVMGNTKRGQVFERVRAASGYRNDVMDMRKSGLIATFAVG
jgi:hypothetical protein